MIDTSRYRIWKRKGNNELVEAWRVETKKGTSQEKGATGRKRLTVARCGEETKT